EGKMGKKTSRNKEGLYGLKGPKDNLDPHLAKKLAEDQARNAGILGLLKSQTGSHVASVFGREEAPQNEPPARDEGPASVRAWFPETFLSEPRLITDPKGQARVTVKIPDRLTTWRVLALAHSRAGAQGGTTAQLLGTLPVYVEIAAPPLLRAGDRLTLPV